MAPYFISFAPWLGMNGPTTMTLPIMLAIGDRLAGADRPVGAEDQEALEIRDWPASGRSAVL